MIIEHYSQNVSNQGTINYEYMNIFPDVFVSSSRFNSPDYIKQTIDFFWNIAYAQYAINSRTIRRNYDLMNGWITKEDFYIIEDSMGNKEKDAEELTRSLIEEAGLPSYVKHYPILNTPVNILLGEYASRGNSFVVKAVDEDSKSEIFEGLTNILNEFILNKALFKIASDLQQQGVDIRQIGMDKIQEMAEEQVRDQIMNFTTRAEKFGNTILKSIVVEKDFLNKMITSLYDFLVCSRFYFLVDEDNSKEGIRFEVLNPVKVWFLPMPDREYTKDLYCAGYVDVMEISEIIERFPWLTKKEIDRLRKDLFLQLGLPSTRGSNLFDTEKTGWESIDYTTYSPLLVQMRQMLESQMISPLDNYATPIEDLLGISKSVTSYGYKYVVLVAYWQGKKKIKKVTYLDEDGTEVTMITDDKYVNGTLNTEISVEEGWVNQWYKGIKIGDYIYHIEEFKLFDGCPIIGLISGYRNSRPASFVDLAKPYQIIYDVCMNQLYSILDKEIGKVGRINLRNVWVPKDSDPKDALDVFIQMAKTMGFVVEEDNPDMTKAPSTMGGRGADVLDLTQSQMIQSRISLAMAVRNECWMLLGFTPNRLGEVMDRQTASSFNISVSQSFAQTEIYFLKHIFVVRDCLQALLDAYQYKMISSPATTISTITSKGESIFMEVVPEDIRLKDLHVFVTYDQETIKTLEKLQSLAQVAIQQGAELYDVFDLFTSNSISAIKENLKKFKEERGKMAMMKNEIDQLKLQLQQLQKMQELEAKMQMHREQLQHQAEQNQQQREHEQQINQDKNQTRLQQLNSKISPEEMLQLEQKKIELEKEKNALKKMEIESKNFNEREKNRLSELEMMLENKIKEINLLITKIQQGYVQNKKS